MVRLVGAGIAMVGVSYGLARYGYGLLLPAMRKDFPLSNAAFGLIATGSYVAYLAASVVVGGIGNRLGPRFPVLIAAVCGIAGMLVLATADSVALLATGVLIAGASSAFAFPPFSDAVAARVAPARRARALAWISCGTGWGVALAVPVAIAVGTRWQLAWVIFAALAAAAAIFAAATLGRVDRGTPDAASQVPRLSWSWFVCPRSGPLLVASLLVGMGASVYWTFGADFVSNGPLRGSAGPVLLAVVGIASVLGSITGDFVERVGGRAAFWVSAAALAGSLAALALLQASWLVLLSAASFGAAYNMIVAVQVVWSSRVFAQRPGTGLAAVLFMAGLGMVAGPPIAGALADAAGQAAAFYAAAALIAVSALLAPREELRQAGRTPDQPPTPAAWSDRRVLGVERGQ